jgi:hypothetical protein
MKCFICNNELEAHTVGLGHFLVCPIDNIIATLGDDGKVKHYSCYYKQYSFNINYITNKTTVSKQSLSQFNEHTIITIIDSAISMPTSSDDFLKKIKTILTYM